MHSCSHSAGELTVTEWRMAPRSNRVPLLVRTKQTFTNEWELINKKKTGKIWSISLTRCRFGSGTIVPRRDGRVAAITADQTAFVNVSIAINHQVADGIPFTGVQVAQFTIIPSRIVSGYCWPIAKRSANKNAGAVTFRLALEQTSNIERVTNDSRLETITRFQASITFWQWMKWIKKNNAKMFVIIIIWILPLMDALMEGWIDEGRLTSDAELLIDP